MTFEHALVVLKNGGRVYRKSWMQDRPQQPRELMIDIGRLYEVVHGAAESVRPYEVGSNDLMADDWEQVSLT